MAPVAVTQDNSSTTSPSGDSVSGFIHISNIGHYHTNEQPNRYTNGSTGYADGHADEHARGQLNGCTTERTNGGFINGGSHANVNDGPANSGKPMPVAIVGMACRMPGDVSTPAEFWELCARARSGWTEVPKERFDNARFHHPNPGKGGTLNPVGGHFLDLDLAAFDAPFFGLTEKEAISMDPQQRLLLECTFEAFENAGIPKQTIVGKNVGVFIGGSFAEYESHLFRDSDTIPMHQATGRQARATTSLYHGPQTNWILPVQDVRLPCNPTASRTSLT